MVRRQALSDRRRASTLAYLINAMPSLFARFILIFFSLSSLTNAKYTYSVFEEGFQPDGWSKVGAVDGHTSISMSIALTQRNLDKGYQYLLNVSDPASPNYGSFWSIDEVYDKFAPSEESFNAVKEWLIASGIHSSAISRSEDRGWVYVQALAHEAEGLLRAKYHFFSHRTGALSIASDGYFIPDTLKEIIDFVQPGSVPRAPMKYEMEKPSPIVGDSGKGSGCDEGNFAGCNSNNLTCCNQVIHPGCIRALYSLPEPDSSATKLVTGNELGIFEPCANDTRKDLNMFFRKWAPYMPNGTYPKEKFYGVHNCKSRANAEAGLDYDCAYPTIWPRNILSIQRPLYITYFSKNKQPPNVISSSWPDTGESGKFGVKFIRRTCNEFMKVGLMGTSVLQASGDNGVGVPYKGQNIFALLVPIDCPYITTVGATEIAANSTVFKPERAAYQKEGKYPFTSGGGFSQLFNAPSYQKEAIATYFSQHDPKIPYYNGTKELKQISRYKYNRLGRGVPDIAASGKNVAVVFDGKCGKRLGTSASAPIVAGIINKIAAERVKAGKNPKLGLLNPAFYANPSMFNDITEGYNLFGKEDVAFRAVKGWDPVTGLGTPNYPKMLEYFLSLK